MYSHINWSYKISYIAILTLGLLILGLSSNNYANADEETETYDGIIIENAYVQTDQTTPSSKLKLNITNQSSDNLTLVGIASDWFEDTRLLIRMPEKGLVEADTLSILQEETLELDTSHIVIELRNLKRAIKAGEKIEFELIFADQIVSVLADVHPSNS